MSRRPDVDHNNNLHKAASLDNAEALLEKALNLGLVLEEDAFTGTFTLLIELLLHISAIGKTIDLVVIVAQRCIMLHSMATSRQ